MSLVRYCTNKTIISMNFYKFEHFFSGKKIEMTIPVATKVDHRNGNLRSYELCLYLPSEYQKQPPKPLDNSIKIVSYPELHLYSKYVPHLHKFLKRIKFY
jgi:hypothetical protein